MKFSPMKIASRTKDGAYTLAVITFSYIILSKTYGVIEQILFYGNSDWNDGLGLYISVSEIVVISVITVLVFRCRKIDGNSGVVGIWSAWQVVKYNWLMLVALIVAVTTVLFFTPQKNVDRLIDEALRIYVFIDAAIFIPWSAMELRTLLRQRIAVEGVRLRQEKKKKEKSLWNKLWRSMFVYSDQMDAADQSVSQKKEPNRSSAQTSGAHTRSGWSKEVDSLGDEYIGEFKKGKRSGRGTLNYADGGQYVGEFLDGHTNGRGTYTASDGSRYVGEFRKGTWHGSGVFTTSDGDEYTGTFDQGVGRGSGTLKFAEGGNYIGDFSDDLPNGYGTYTYPDGGIYIGTFVDGNRSGAGRLSAKNGDVYEGDWADDCFYGQGVYTWADGSRYNGSWRSDKRHGYGIQVTEDCKELAGVWVDDILQSKDQKSSDIEEPSDTDSQSKSSFVRTAWTLLLNVAWIIVALVFTASVFVKVLIALGLIESGSNLIQLITDIIADQR